LTNLLQKSTCSKCGATNSTDINDLDESIRALTKMNYYKKNSEIYLNNTNEDIKLPKFNINENRMVRISKKMLGSDGT
jgi:hypothetical protein